MNGLVNLGNRILNVAPAFAWLPPLLARFTLGATFLLAGLGKLQNMDRTIGFFTSLGLPAPAFNAMLVGWVEFLGGILLIAGLGTRLASIPLSIIMIVAMLTAKSGDITGILALRNVHDFLYFVLLVWLMVAGPGKIALDTLMADKYRR